MLCTLTTRDDHDASDIRSDDYRYRSDYHQLTISPTVIFGPIISGRQIVNGKGLKCVQPFLFGVTIVFAVAGPFVDSKSVIF